MTLAAVLIGLLGLQGAPPPVALPDECPRLLITWRPGYPSRSTPLSEIRSAVVAAVWDSGLVLRAETLEPPAVAYVVGQATPADVAAFVAAVKDSDLWTRPGGLPVDAASYELHLLRGDDRLGQSTDTASPAVAAIRRRVFALRLAGPRRLTALLPPDRWRCPPVVWRE